MKVSNEGTEFMRRNESKINEDKHINFGFEFLHDFKGMCAEQAAVSDHVDLSHLNQSQQSAAKSLVEEYAPERNANAPEQIKIILKDEIPVYQHPRRLPVCDQKTVDDQVQDWLAEKMIKSSYAQFKGLVDTVKSMHIAQTHFSQAGQRNSYREIKVFDGNRRESSSNFWEHCHTC